MSDNGKCQICDTATQDLYADIFDDRHGYPQLLSIQICPNCGFGRTVPALKREELAGVYQQYYPRRNLTAKQVKTGFEAARAKSNLSVWLEGAGTECYRYIEPGSRVLDVGCGNCVSLLMAKELGAKEAVGIEVDPNLEPIARSLNLDLHLGQLGDLPESYGNFDFVLARQVLEHDPDPKQFLMEMKQRLQPGGRIVLSFPNVNALYRYIFKDKWLHWHVPYHINHFSPQSVRILARACDLKIITLKTVTPNGWMGCQLRTLKAPIALGQRDTFWDPPPPQISSERSQPSPQPSLLVTKARQVKNYLLNWGITPLNRSLDFLGRGESFVVILSE